MKTITVIETVFDGTNVMESITVEYGVNERGNGLWKNDRQIIGTCDFHAASPSDLMRKLKRGIQDYETIKMVRNSAVGW